MFDLPLAFHLCLHAISFDKKSLRFPTPRRLLTVLITLPCILLLVLINRSFMLADHLLFPVFRKIKASNGVFITGVPRSATTFLYHLLARDEQNFTCFKLWEILFAPSIIQKYILSWVLRFDRIVGRPLYRASLWWDRMFLARIARLHDTGLSRPEEDEMLLVYAFASAYLTYLFPGVRALEPYLLFDEGISVAKRKKIMHYYKACIQRHVYFYDPKEEKCFLSKNPGFVSKTTSLAETFENATLIYMLRSPLKTIPSTISLNKNVFSIFSDIDGRDTHESETRDMVIRWYGMADRSIATHWQHRSMTVPFRKITRETDATVLAIYEYLNRQPGIALNHLADKERDAKYAGTHVYPPMEEDPEVQQALAFVFEGAFRDQL